MALLGSDFNAASPVSGDNVRHDTDSQMATELRDLKPRIKAFFTVNFKIGSGADKDENPQTGSIPAAALKDLSPDPTSGQQKWRSVTVSRKGQVVAGSLDFTNLPPRIFRAVFTASEWNGSAYITQGLGHIDTESDVKVVYGQENKLPSPLPFPGSLAALDVDGGRSTHYQWEVPAKVASVQLTLAGGYSDSTKQSVRLSRRVGLTQRLLDIYVAESSVGVSLIGPFYSAEQWVFSIPATSFSASLNNTAEWYSPTRFTNYGSSSNPGIVIVEWYV